MNLAQMLAQNSPKSVSKAESLAIEHMLSGDESNFNASFGIGSDSFHYGVQEVVPPKNTTQVENPGDKIDKKRRKSKVFRKYETQLQFNQGGRKTLVQTQQVDNNDYMDVARSSWFV